MNELEIKVGEAITLLTNMVRDAESALKSARQAEEKKNSLLSDITYLSSRLATLRDENGIEQQKIKDKQAELDRLTGRVKSTIETAETQAQVASALQAQVVQERQEIARKSEEYNQKNMELNRRENELVTLNDQIHKEIAEFEIRLKTSNIDEREKQANTLIEKARHLREEARLAQEKADQALAQANYSIEQTNKSAESNSLLKIRLDQKNLEVEERLKSLQTEIIAVEKQKEDLQAQELRINKIIREKNIEEALIKS